MSFNAYKHRCGLWLQVLILITQFGVLESLISLPRPLWFVPSMLEILILTENHRQWAKFSANIRCKNRFLRKLLYCSCFFHTRFLLENLSLSVSFYYCLLTPCQLSIRFLRNFWLINISPKMWTKFQSFRALGPVLSVEYVWNLMYLLFWQSWIWQNIKILYNERNMNKNGLKSAWVPFFTKIGVLAF